MATTVTGVALEPREVFYQVDKITHRWTILCNNEYVEAVTGRISWRFMLTLGYLQRLETVNALP